MACKGVLPSGQSYEEIPKDEADKLKKLWFMYADGVVSVQPDNRYIRKNLLKFIQRFYDFNWRPSDIFISSFPKSGTTWTQEIIWNLVRNPNLDNTESDLSISVRFLDFETDTYLDTTGSIELDRDGSSMNLFRQICPGKDWKEGLTLQLASALPSPRMLKSHQPLDFFPPDITKKCKTLYVLRDPRDVMSSVYHFCRLHKMWGFRGSLQQFLDQFLEDKIVYGPYWSHIRVAWEKRHDPNICIIFYEDLQADALKEIKRIDKFLGTNRTVEQMENVMKFASFDQMKERTKDNPPCSHDGKFFNKEVAEKEGGFFRKGIVGDWKNRFNEDQITKINEWMERNLKDFGDDFKYKL